MAVLRYAVVGILFLFAGLGGVGEAEGAVGSDLDSYWLDKFPIPGTDFYVNTVATDSEGNMYVGGRFTAAGNVIANGVAKWDCQTSRWCALGTGMNGEVRGLAADSAGHVYAVGSFTTAGGVPVVRFAMWDGANWCPLEAGLLSGAVGTVNAIVVDGSDNLYAGGSLVLADFKTTCLVAKWDGAEWTALATGTTGTIGDVTALALDESGNLCAGGYFTSIGGTPAVNVAKWDGTSWSAIESGIASGLDLNQHVEAVTWGGSGNIYAAMNFLAEGVWHNEVARWDGTTWSFLGDGFDARVESLTADADGNIYAGGSFDKAGGVWTYYVAKWDGMAWSAVGGGVDASSFTAVVYALTVDGDGSIYAAGWFTRAGDAVAHGVAKWDGEAWSGFGTGLGTKDVWRPAVLALAVDACSHAYVGGYFTTTGDVEANYVAEWNGTAWSALGAGVDKPVYALALDDSGNLYAGGMFAKAGGAAARHVAKWDGATWSTLGTGLQYEPKALVVDSKGNLYAGGYFTTAGGVAANRVGKWDGTSWSALGTGLEGTGLKTHVTALAVDSLDNLYAAGSFTTAGGVPANIAKWDGSAWSAFGTAVGANVYCIPKALAVDLWGAVYVGGRFGSVDGVNANHIARWDGAAWSALGSGVEMDDNVVPEVTALAADDFGNVYAGGHFMTANGVVVNNLAKWDGNQWSAVGSGTNDTVNALATDRSGNVYIGGFFSTAGAKVSGCFAVWQPYGEGEAECEGPDDEPPVGCFGAEQAL